MKRQTKAEIRTVSDQKKQLALDISEARTAKAAVVAALDKPGLPLKDFMALSAKNALLACTITSKRRQLNNLEMRRPLLGEPVDAPISVPQLPK